MLSQGRFAITDRLHGHILCLLMGIPHVVLNDRYGKISNFYETWTSGNPLAYWAESLSEAVRIGNDLGHEMIPFSIRRLLLTPNLHVKRSTPAAALVKRSRPRMTVWHEAPEKKQDSTTYSVVIETDGSARQKLWYRVPSQHTGTVTSSADPFVLGLLFLAMEKRADLVVHGQVSPSLLRNLSEFQDAWASWLPKQFGQVVISADKEKEVVIGSQELAIAAFTGGIDSCFTVWRHRTGHCGRWQRKVEAGLFVHGFDIPLKQEEAFERASSRARDTLSSLGVRLLTMATNLKEMIPDWSYTHGAGLASCLMLTQRRYSVGLIGSSFSYSDLETPWGSNTITDHLLSSQRFQVIHDGAAFERSEKIQRSATCPRDAESQSVFFG